MIKQNNQLDVYRMIADPTRRKILELLREQERPVQSLQSHLPITLGAISQHLQLLHRSGLVSRTRRGKQRIYRLEARNLDEIDHPRRHQPTNRERLDQLEAASYPRVDPETQIETALALAPP